MDVAFNRPITGALARRYAAEALAGDAHAGDGPWGRRAEAALADLHGGSRVLLVPSGTDALELAMMTLGIGPGDEVICPSFTFTSTATAPARSGARIRFADVDPRTQGVTVETIEPLVTSHTKAIISVHYAGIAHDQARLRAWADSRGIALVEDNAHGLGGEWAGRPLGTHGQFAALSFHESKNLSCGEGGALVINDPTLVELAECIREKGTNRSAFMRGHVDKYTWVSPGSSFLLPEVLAAVLMGNLEDFAETQATRQSAWASYDDALRGAVAAAGFQGPFVPDEATHPAHLYYLIAPDEAARDRVLAGLNRQGIASVFHYQPLHSSAGGLQASHGEVFDCPVSDRNGSRLFRLPLHGHLTGPEVGAVIECALDALR